MLSMKCLDDADQMIDWKSRDVSIAKMMEILLVKVLSLKRNLAFKV